VKWYGGSHGFVAKSFLHSTPSNQYLCAEDSHASAS
jgi:hypothetical protein